MTGAEADYSIVADGPFMFWSTAPAEDLWRWQWLEEKHGTKSRRSCAKTAPGGDGRTVARSLP